MRVTEDQQRNEWCYIMTREVMDSVGQEPHYLVRLFVLHYDDLFEIKEGLEEPIDRKLISQDI